MPLEFKIQSWAEDLRLPCIMPSADTVSLLSQVEMLRKPSIPFQSRHLPALKRNTWYVLRRPADRSRSGLMCIWPQQQCCVFISGDPVTSKHPTPRIALLRLRIDPQFLAAGTGLTVFSATLSAVSRRLWIEDVYVWKGRQVAEEDTMGERWALVTQWLSHYHIPDPQLVGGLELEAAAWKPLDDLRPSGVWELQSDEPRRKRLFWIANRRDAAPPTPVATITDTTATTTTTTITTTTDNLISHVDTATPLIAIATRESGPDQWHLTSADNKSLGRALIRTLQVSSALRDLKSAVAHVEVTWNSVFDKWEIKNIVMDKVAVGHSNSFIRA